jgi:hypothetical protein
LQPAKPTATADPFAKFVYPLDAGLVRKLVGRARLCLTQVQYSPLSPPP